MDLEQAKLLFSFNIINKERADTTRLFNGDRLGKVAGLINVAAATDGNVIGKELEGDDLNERGEQFEGGWDENDVLDEACERAAAHARSDRTVYRGVSPNGTAVPSSFACVWVACRPRRLRKKSSGTS